LTICVSVYLDFFMWKLLIFYYRIFYFRMVWFWGSAWAKLLSTNGVQNMVMQVVNIVKRLKELEVENSRLKKMYLRLGAYFWVYSPSSCEKMALALSLKCF
jgi:uncharacterized membrane protein YobD (UPF0266 family)